MSSTATGKKQPAGKIPQRGEIDSRYQWRVRDIYADDADWRADFEAADRALREIGAFAGRLGESGASLLAFLRKRDEVEDLIDRLAVYASLRRDEDMRDSTYQAMADQAALLATRSGEAMAFAEPELLELPAERLRRLCEEDSGLDLYAHALDNLLRRKPHTLPASEEKLLAMGADFSATPSVVFGMFNNADLRFGTVPDDDGNEIELTKARFAALQNSKNRTVREKSWRALHQGYHRYQNTLAANLAGQVKRHIYTTRARHYTSCLHAALHGANIPTGVYRNLIRTVRERIEPLHRYVETRKRILGVESLKPWDMAVPLRADSERKYTWEEAVATVREGVIPLGREYVDAFDEGIAGGWIDVYESEGKRGGAYSWGAYSTKPYVLLNYNDTLDDLFTLAHEMGHSIHSLLTRRNQPYVYGSYPIFLAEVASTTNEALLIERLIAKSEERQERIGLINHYLDQIRGTFFVQVMFADFELRIHEQAEKGGSLTPAWLADAYRQIYRDYHGDTLEPEPIADAGWARIPHFYYNFYVYQYATSYAAATALAARILKGEPGIVERYLVLLKAGWSDYPIPLLQEAGVDLSSPEPIVDTISRFSSLLAELTDLLE